MVAEFDKTKIVPGVLCKRGHDSTGDGRSLRYISGGQCIECSRLNRESNRERRKEWLKEYNQANQETLRQKARENYLANREKRLAQVKEYTTQNKERIQAYKKEYADKNREKIQDWMQGYRENNKEKIRASRQSHYQRNRENLLQKSKIYRQNNPEKGRAAKIRFKLQNPEARKASHRRRRANKRNAHKAPYTVEQFKAQWDLFSNCCAYCGSTEKPNVDHFIPLYKGGSETLSNLIPACQRCNFSKNSSDPLEWYKKQPFFSQKRWRFILKVLGKTEANYSQIPLF